MDSPEGFSFLFDLPVELLGHIVGYLGWFYAVRLARTSRAMFGRLLHRKVLRGWMYASRFKSVCLARERCFYAYYREIYKKAKRVAHPDNRVLDYVRRKYYAYQRQVGPTGNVYWCL